jgi:hypothetical protein
MADWKWSSFMVTDMKKEEPEIQYKDGVHRQVEMLDQLSKRLDDYFALRSLGAKWTDDQVPT